jgi:hypothetical protein
MEGTEKVKVSLLTKWIEHMSEMLYDEVGRRWYLIDD